MRIVKIIGILVLVYIGIVIAFESMLGYVQPQREQNIVITTTDTEGSTHDRVVTPRYVDDTLYIAANHWPRAWYNRVLENSDVDVTIDGVTESYHAVKAVGEEYEMIKREYVLPFPIRFLTGFPPREFVRLDPS